MFFQDIGRDRRRHQLVDFRTARALRPRQHRIEHGAARVGVDFDQSEGAVGYMKVVAEEDAPGAARVVLRDGG